jgi:hypothetical protein
MTLPQEELYPTTLECIWVLYDLRDPQTCEHLQKQRATWRELSDLAALGPDHKVLMLFACGAGSVTRNGRRG